ncbi:MAG: phenylalanine--tRNA ligase subunit beta, partial [Nanoarchaeota archaeon]
MPTITLSKKALERLVGKKLPDAIIKDTMIMLGTCFEGIEGDAVSVEVFPNRPDLLSEAGMARALASLLGIKTGLRKYDARKGRYTVVVDKSVNKVRPRTACA